LYNVLENDLRLSQLHVQFTGDAQFYNAGVTFSSGCCMPIPVIVKID